jgi:hypothetical protein
MTAARSGTPASHGVANRIRQVAGEVVLVLPAYLTARLLVAAAFVLGIVVADDLVPGQRPETLRQGLTAWDGQWYGAIATEGYEGIPREGLRFFPLFPLVARWVDAVLPGGIDVALVVVANLCALVFAVVARRLVLHETGDAALASLATWTLALFPASFVLVWGYAEPMMLAAAAGALLSMRRRRWLAAGALGAVAALARPLGAFLALAAALEAARGIATATRGERLERLAAVIGPLVGLGAYLAWVGVRFDDWLLPLTVQEDFRGEARDPLRRILDGLGDLVGPEALGDGLHVPFAIGFVALLVIGVRRWPASFTVFAAAVLATSLGADNLNSLERYGLNAFPIVLTLAWVARRWHVERVVLTVAAGGMVALSALASLGPYVP